MKFKKIISKSLIVGLLLNSGLISFAGVLSEDGRYETFEGNNITIGNILEEDEVDVEIEGNTLVNLWTGYSHTSHSWLQGEIIHDITGKTITIFNYSNKPIIFELSTNDGSNDEYSNYSRGIRIDAGSSERIDVLNTEAFRMIQGLFDLGWENTSEDISKFDKSLVIVEGDWTDEGIPNYFEGMQSVGQDDTGGHKIELKSHNKNLLNLLSLNHGSKPNTRVEDLKSNSLKLITLPENTDAYASVFFDDYPFVPGKEYRFTAKCIKSNSENAPGFSVRKENHSEYIVHFIADSNGVIDGVFRPTNKSHRIEFFGGNHEGPIADTSVIFEDIEITMVEDTPGDKYMDNQSDSNLINLSEPLRGLPSGVKDRIIKKDGQWVIERNCKEVVLNGSENWVLDEARSNEYTSYFRTDDFILETSFNSDYNYSTDFHINDKYIRDSAENNWYLVNASSPNFDINRNNTISIREYKMGLSEFKTMLKNNPVTVVYQLKTPIYESLNIESTLNLYEDITYISNSSNIPASMKVVVDRVANRAKEAIELAEGNPTIENLSNARYWTNLMRESILKDSFQNKTSSITDVEGLDIEKKSATINADIYIKPKNMLSLSLDTNSIVFDEVDATENVEMQNAVNLTISSSLPYQVNAYLESEIYNSDKTEVLDKSVINIKANSSNEYKTFTGLSSPLILLDDQDAGMNNMHGIDLKLMFNSIHKADVYKTTVKFEAEQK